MRGARPASSACGANALHGCLALARDTRGLGAAGRLVGASAASWGPNSPRNRSPAAMPRYVRRRYPSSWPPGPVPAASRRSPMVRARSTSGDPGGPVGTGSRPAGRDAEPLIAPWSIGKLTVRDIRCRYLREREEWKCLVSSSGPAATAPPILSAAATPSPPGCGRAPARLGYGWPGSGGPACSSPAGTGASAAARLTASVPRTAPDLVLSLPSRRSHRCRP